MKPMTRRAAIATVAAAAVLAGTAQAKLEDPAASYYTPHALEALGMQWEAKAHFYGKQSASLKKKQQVPAMISTSPPEGLEPAPVAEPAAPTPLPLPIPCPYLEEMGLGDC